MLLLLTLQYASPRPELLEQERILQSAALRAKSLLLGLVLEGRGLRQDPLPKEMKYKLSGHYSTLKLLLKECTSAVQGLPRIDFDEAESWCDDCTCYRANRITSMIGSVLTSARPSKHCGLAGLYPRMSSLCSTFRYAALRLVNTRCSLGTELPQ